MFYLSYASTHQLHVCPPRRSSDLSVVVMRLRHVIAHVVIDVAHAVIDPSVDQWCRVITGDGRIDDRMRHIKDRKSTRLNSSHLGISYAVFSLKKKSPS